MTRVTEEAAAARAHVEDYAKLGEIYDEKWYAQSGDGSLDAARLYAAYLRRFIQPASVLDVGCGRGQWLKAWGEHGAQSLMGLDGHWNCQEKMVDASIRFEPVDLDRPFAIAGKVDLAMSLEVAEHLSPTAAGTFVASLSATSDLILFSAAYIHQGGPHHTNERRHTYWAGLFAQHGFVPVDALRPVFWADERIAFWYRQNAFLYVRQGSASLAQLAAQGLLPMAHVGFMDCVHPTLYACKLEDIAKLVSRQPDDHG
jgi:SAM-dependent methyltransferase